MPYAGRQSPARCTSYGDRPIARREDGCSSWPKEVAPSRARIRPGLSGQEVFKLGDAGFIPSKLLPFPGGNELLLATDNQDGMVLKDVRLSDRTATVAGSFSDESTLPVWDQPGKSLLFGPQRERHPKYLEIQFGGSFADSNYVWLRARLQPHAQTLGPGNLLKSTENRRDF